MVVITLNILNSYDEVARVKCNRICNIKIKFMKKLPESIVTGVVNCNIILEFMMKLQSQFHDLLKMEVNCKIWLNVPLFFFQDC